MRFAISPKPAIAFGLVVALPLLALPVAVKLISFRFGDAPPADSTALPLQGGPAEAVALPMIVERYSPADVAGPASAALLESRGIDSASSPPLAPQTTFDPLWTPARSTDAAAEEVTIDDRTIDQLQRIRLRLEELGADYVIVESTEFGGRFRFHCRVNVEPHSRFTRPFEAISLDPLAAGEQVLREVEAWRLAAANPRLRQE
jgi:hypothetical protein